MNQIVYLNFSSAERKKYIYRIIPLKRLYELFETANNVLVKPRKWQDPFENLISKSIRMESATPIEFPYRENFYGQCWTFKQASDALWRIYSPDGRAVRIRSKIRTLAESLNRISLSLSDEIFIGKVQYLPTKKILELVKKVGLKAAKPEIKPFASTLLFKRYAFSHEREVRLLLFKRDDFEDDLFKYQVNPHKLIDHIMIDPRMSQMEAEKLRSEIRTKTEFKGDIKRSLLYAPPPRILIS